MRHKVEECLDIIILQLKFICTSFGINVVCYVKGLYIINLFLLEYLIHEKCLSNSDVNEELAARRKRNREDGEKHLLHK